MSRIILASLLVMLLALPAMATVHENNGTDPHDITINLNIPCYTNVYWNNTDDDHTINFCDVVQNGSNNGDWWRDPSSGVRGAYSANDALAFPYNKPSQDAFAQGYYESYDHAFFWLESNCNVDWTVTDNGDLSNGSSTIPTWFTIAFSNNTDGGGGFIDGGARQSCGQIPLDGYGTYAQDSGGDLTMTLFACTDDGGGSAFHPNQWPFPCNNSSWTTASPSFSAFCQGTVLFHARALRSGLQDQAGSYTTSIDMAFTNP